jgi:hypothetical protein
LSAGVTRQPVPDHALQASYLRQGAYADCYVIHAEGEISLAQFVAAFYTTWLFKLERWILGWTVHKRSTDEQAWQIASGEITQFAAWSMELRAPDQLLMCDFMNATRSWFMVAPGAKTPGTRLYFGSVVTSRVNAKTGQRELGRSHRWLMGFHRLYSRALLRAARARLSRGESPIRDR